MPTNEVQLNATQQGIFDNFRANNQNLISTNQLETANPLTLPTSGQTAIPDSLTQFTQTSPQTQQKQAQLQQGQASNAGTLNEIFSGLTTLGTRGATQSKLEDQAGIGQMSTELTDIENQLRAKDLEFRRQREAIQASGGLEGQRNLELRDVSRNQASELADLEVIRQARSNSLTNAQSLIDKKVQLHFADVQAKVDALKFVYNENKETLTKEEDRLLNETIRKEERAFGIAKDEYQRFSTSQIQSVQNAQLAGASNQDLQNIMSKKNMTELLSDPSTARFMVSPKEKLELQKLGLDVRNSNLEYQTMLNDLNQAKNYLQGTTGDPTLDIISASAQYGDKRLTDSQLEKIQQATSALGSMESLQGLLGISSTGPVKGKARQLVAGLGGDADAKAINATIQGLIPTVARGIFGEVGVLTDADIANYRKTVPNLTSTADQNRLISLVMYDVLSRSVKNTLTTNARNQANVSNFAPVYQDVEGRITKLKSELGVGNIAPITEGDRTKLESAWSNTSLSPQAVTNSLNSFLQ